MRATSILLLLLFLLAPAPSAAAGASSTWHVGAEAVTEVPIHMGVRIAVEGPYRIRLDSSLGYFPGFYIDGLNEILKIFPLYNDQVADLVKAALESSLIWRTHIGWRPFSGAGFYFSAGYGMVSLGGGAGAEELLVAVSKEPPPEGTLPERRGYDVASTLHMIDAEVGWELLIVERFTLRAAVGGAFTLGAATDISPRFTPKRATKAAIEEFTGQTATFLDDDIYKRFVHTPVVSLSVGYRFM